jgi:radical SAM protein with 4Fe4S-binding SPASM domain
VARALGYKLDKPLVVYLKTTETCNLNCLHCFTNGTNGAKVYWDHVAVADWLHRLHKERPNIPYIHCEFHGGEPFLADINSMRYVYDQCKDIWPSMGWGITTNLTFKLDQEKIDFIQGPLGNRIGTSWDPDIRFANPKQYDLWRKNVETLINLGVTIKLFISVTKGTIAIEPIELLEWVRDLGVKEMALERLTMNGSAKSNAHIFPTNLEQDAWFLKMHQQIKEHDTRSWFRNEFMETVYSKFEQGAINHGTFCRDCEETLFTLNADGTIAGCPNSAPEQYFGKISDEIRDLLTNPQRIQNIACERSRDPRCYECNVFQYCNSDCHQLEWQNDVCGAPKSLMQELANINTGRKYPVFQLKEL